MILPAFLFLSLLPQQAAAPAKPAPKPAVKSSAATASEAAPGSSPAKKTPPGPKTAAELQQDLAAALHADPLQPDTVTVAIQDQTLTLSGVVHEAEHKGVATRVARAIALRDGWTHAHVVNHLDVQLAHP